MNIGVVGANGFLGSNICSHYLGGGHSVYAFVNNSSNRVPTNCGLIFRNYVFDLKLDYLFLCLGNYASSQEDQMSQTKYIIELLKRFSQTKIILISSTAVYGIHDDIIKLDSCYKNTSLYGSFKLLQENIVKSLSNNYCVIRPTYVYGKEMSKNSLISVWIQSAIRNREITVYGEGSRTQDYIHISDLIQFCDKALYTQGTILAATGVSETNLTLAENICKLVPNSKIVFCGSDNSASYKFEIQAEFKFKKLEQQLQELVDYEISDM